MMELRQDLDKGKATFTAVSEFLLTHPVLSFGVRDVAQSRLRHTEVLPAEEESESLTTGLCMCARALKLLKTRNCFFFVLHVYIFVMFYVCYAFRRHSRTHRVQVWNPNQTLLCAHQVRLFSSSLFYFLLLCEQNETVLKCQVAHVKWTIAHCK